MMPCNALVRLLFAISVAISFAVSCPAASSDDSVAGEQVVFLPFRVKNAPNYTYLQDGASNIVACRLL
ncbi:MAG: hypothetical protein OEV64_13105, partial [Desulfobulbaceae bacterium]|nr:hypothetical protein [Desulfobulbaceae bacterium]